MTVLFSDAVYLGVTLTEDTYAKPAEPMAAAVKRWMTRRKRELHTVQRSFPKFTPGMTTQTYVQLYYIGLNTSPRDYIVPLNRPAPFFTGPEIEETTDA